MLCAKHRRPSKVEQAPCGSASGSLDYLKFFREPFCGSENFTPKLNCKCGNCPLLPKSHLSLRVGWMRESCGCRSRTANWMSVPLFSVLATSADIQYRRKEGINGFRNSGFVFVSPSLSRQAFWRKIPGGAPELWDKWRT